MNRQNDMIGVVVLAYFAFAFGIFGAWITHMVWSIRTLMEGGASNGEIALAAAGAFAPPLGIIHGVMLWLGVGM